MSGRSAGAAATQRLRAEGGAAGHRTAVAVLARVHGGEAGSGAAAALATAASGELLELRAALVAVGASEGEADAWFNAAGSAFLATIRAAKATAAPASIQ